MNPKIIVLGAGPCGLGAALRLDELHHENFLIFEKQTTPGGLSSSFIDEKGFTWDVGGHVQFSHYKYFDNIMDEILKDEWLYHERSSWIWLKNRFVPYPFQNNLRLLDKEDILKCIDGLIDAQQKENIKKPENFKDWIVSNFGIGIAELFMIPYNYKVWAYPAEKLSYSWVGERVATINLKKIIYNIIMDKDEISWGPNNKFRFPLHGGTGEIWKRVFNKLNKDKIVFNEEFLSIDLNEKIITFKSGRKEKYDHLITTIPLDHFAKMSNLPNRSTANSLIHSSVHIFGFGMTGKIPEKIKDKNWIYFPEKDCTFYRATIFSNYSPNNVPNIKKYWSLMVEVSESSDKILKKEILKEETIKGLINTGLISNSKDIFSIWEYYAPYGYPTPSLNRDNVLKILKDLEKLDVYSRGRFGAWKYEVSNQDHTFMQGVESVNKILLGEEELTVWKPEKVNSRSAKG